MGVHFISILGTGLYEPAVYHFPGKEGGEKERQFVQITMLDAFKEQITEGGKVSVFLTDKARSMNWENRTYDENDAKSAKLWKSGRKREVCEGHEKQGLKSILEKEYPELSARTKEWGIRNASTEEEIWSVFETIYNAIDENDEIVFDITHSFRSIPMLAITIINYAKVLKNCSLKGIYYGAFDASKTDEEAEVKHVPVVDLTIYDEILDWANAAEAFMRYGFASKMKEVYDKKMKKVPDNEKKDWSAINGKIKAMDRMASAIFTCRGTDASKLEDGKKRGNELRSIMNAYQNLVKKSTDESQAKAREIKPLYPLIEKIEGRYQDYFAGKTNFEVGCGVVRWSIKNHMVQQGYTALEETMITYLCEQYGLDDRTEETREDVVGNALTGIIQYCAKNHAGKKFEENREAAWEEIYRRLPRAKDGEAEGAEEEKRRKHLRKIIMTVPMPFVQLCDRIKAKRNDINHFGFREKPASSEKLIIELEALHDEFRSLTNADIDMSAYECTFPENTPEGGKEDA